MKKEGSYGVLTPWFLLGTMNEWFKGRVGNGPRESGLTGLILVWFTQSHPAIILMLDSGINIIYFAIS